MIITVPIIGGTELDPYRPDTDHIWWQLIEAKQNEFVIEVFDEE